MIKQAGRCSRGIAAAFVLAIAVSSFVRAAAVADSRCDELVKALGAGDFSAATAHFDSSMKAGLSPEKLRSTWQGLTTNAGKLLGSEITTRTAKNGEDVVIATLKFEHGPDMGVLVAVNPQSGEVSGLYFMPSPPAIQKPTSPPYAQADKFRSETVSVGSPPFVLPGTLTIPTTGTGPWPAVLLLGGSGPNDQDESIGPNHIFKDIAEGLSSRGIVVLRYSKRTLVYGKTMDVQHITIKEEYLDDATAAVNLLRSRKEVAQDRIFIAGHSLGATIAPEVALRVAPVQGLILLAPTGRKTGAAIVQQMRFLGEASHEQLDELERKANELDNHLMPPTENFMGAPASYWYDLDARDEVALARQLKVPILILHGGRDYQVIDKDIEHWQEGLKGVAHVHVDDFPALNHLFIAGTGKPNNQEYLVPGHVDQQVIDAMAAFIGNPLAN